MAGAKPWSRGKAASKTYRLWLNLQNLPVHTSTAMYVYLDETFEGEDVVECTNLHDNFRTDVETYGDIDVTLSSALDVITPEIAQRPSRKR